jgi:hypothetical protein
MGWCGLDSSGSGYGPTEGSCENGNEHLGSIKGGKLLMHIKFLSGNMNGRELGRPGRRWNDTRLDLREIGWESLDWLYLAGQIVDSCEHGNENSGSIKGEEFLIHIKCWSGNIKGRDNLEDLGVDGMIILEWILLK